MVKTPTSNAGAAGSIPGQGTKIPHACEMRPKKKKKSAYLKLIVAITLSTELSIRNVQLQNRSISNFPLSLVLLNIVLEKSSIVTLNKRDANIDKGKNNI